MFAKDTLLNSGGLEYIVAGLEEDETYSYY